MSQATRPGLSFDTRFSAALDTNPSAASSLDLAMDGTRHGLLSTTSDVAILLQQSGLSETISSPRAPQHGMLLGGVSERSSNAFVRFVGVVGRTPRRGWGQVKRVGIWLTPCVLRKQQAELKREGSFFRESSL